MKEEKKTLIIVNSREKEWLDKIITYDQVVVLALGSYSEDDTTAYTVTFSRGDESKKEGSITRGEYVKVKERMVFNVTQTNKS